MRVITIRRLVVFALCNILSGLSTQATGVPNSAFSGEGQYRESSLHHQQQRGYYRFVWRNDGHSC